jgi:hypothetical protein
MGQGDVVKDGPNRWTNWRVATVLMALAAGLYVASVVIILVRN